jgi:hypothetical protein
VTDSGAGNFVLPRWAHVPGRDAQADTDALSRAKSSVPPRYDGFVPVNDPALRYGLALNDEGFFWESHEILEAVWKAAPKGGCDRILLRACIQVANANLKLKMDRPHAVRRLLCEALAELNEVTARCAAGVPDGFAESYAISALSAAIAAQLDRNERDHQPILIDQI